MIGKSKDLKPKPERSNCLMKERKCQESRVDPLDPLRDDLRKSVQERIRMTEKLGRDKAHGQRQGSEQDLIKSIDKVLEDM
jgi:hypothetical protein